MVKKIIFIGSICCSIVSYADGVNYLGIDALYSKLKFQEDFGGNIISKKFTPGINIFGGRMFNEYFGMEIGVELYKKMRRIENKIMGGTMVAGVKNWSGNNDPNYWESFKTTVTQKHPYFGLVWKANFFEKNSISLLTGFSLSKIKARYTIFDDSDGDVKRNGNFVRNFSKTKVIPIIRVSIEHKFNEKVGVRGLLTWKKTSSFTVKSKEDPGADTCIKPKDSFNIGLGVSYYIF